MFRKKKQEEGTSNGTTSGEQIKIEIDNNHRYCINGVQVDFPAKPYPTQITMMNKILQGLERQQHCLLESPTGSGKSLALLCSCLAWQQSEKKRIESKEIDQDNPCLDENGATDLKVDEEVSSRPNLATLPAMDDIHTKIVENDDDDDFVEDNMKSKRKSISKSEKVSSDNSKSKEDTTVQTEWKMEMKMKAKEKEDRDVKKTSSENDNDKKEERVPKIYFGTRTHKQIKQIIRELKKTVYKDVRMSILGSREFLCIHPRISKSKEKNEECKKLVKGTEGGSCRFHNNYPTLTKHSVREKHKLNGAWDIEDLITAGKKIKACPYYGSRELIKGAEVIFCPYNYLVDPLIRLQMQINLKNQVIVLDEAHNIEDTARESASITLTMLQLEDTKQDLQDMITAGIMCDAHTCLKMLIDGLLEWMDGLKTQLDTRGFESEAKVWNGKEIAKMFADEQKLRLNEATVKIYMEQLSKIVSIEYEQNNDGYSNDELKLSTKSISVIEHIMFILQKLLDEETSYAADYRVVLSRTSVMVHKNIQLPGGWLKKSKQAEKVWTYKINFWCLNPAVVFSELGNECRSIILSSGTLSPMNSFSSELGVKFPISLEANHVIADSQVWVGNLTVGPSNTVLNANYKNSETFAFQDDVGKVIMQICKTIPKGVLCFFPSYSMMEKLSKRWKSTSLWDQMSLSKVIFTEPRGGDKNEFDDILNCFYECVSTNDSATTGALLLAVCRGKVSEGLDFSDDNARAVITIGIPFPNFKDLQVELKRKYNNEHTAKRGLLNGSEWYDIQAFRALNQALGRCIRHKNDWGALLIVDERFSKSPKYRNGLSKWVRSKVKIFNDFQVCLTSMAEFTDRHLSGIKDDTKTTNCPLNTTENLIQLKTNNVDLPLNNESEIETPVVNKAVQLSNTKSLVKEKLTANRSITGENTPIQKSKLSFTSLSKVANIAVSKSISLNTDDNETDNSQLSPPVIPSKRKFSFQSGDGEKIRNSKSLYSFTNSTSKNNASNLLIQANDINSTKCSKQNVQSNIGKSHIVKRVENNDINDEDMSMLSTQMFSPERTTSPVKKSRRILYDDTNSTKQKVSSKRSRFSYPLTTKKGVFSSVSATTSNIEDIEMMKGITKVELENEETHLNNKSFHLNQSLNLNQSLIKSLSEDFKMKPISNNKINNFKKDLFDQDDFNMKDIEELHTKSVQKTTMLKNSKLTDKLSAKNCSTPLVKSLNNLKPVLKNTYTPLAKQLSKPVQPVNPPISPVLFGDQDAKLGNEFQEEFFDISEICKDIDKKNDRKNKATKVQSKKENLQIKTETVKNNIAQNTNNNILKRNNNIDSSTTNECKVNINKNINKCDLKSNNTKATTKNISNSSLINTSVLNESANQSLGVRRSKRTSNSKKRKNIRTTTNQQQIDNTNWMLKDNDEDLEALAKAITPQKKFLHCKTCKQRFSGTDSSEKTTLNKILPSMGKSSCVYKCNTAINDSTLDLVVKEQNNTSVELNSYYDSGDNSVYILLHCGHCCADINGGKNIQPIAVKWMDIKTMKYSIYMFEDGIIEKK